MEILKIRSIKKLDTQSHVYDLSVDETHNFFVGEQQVLTSNCDGMTPDAQRALRNVIEEYSDTLRFILTANYKNRVSEPLKSRTLFYELMPSIDGIKARLSSILTQEKRDPSEYTEAIDAIAHKCYPDVRRAIILLQRHVESNVPIADIADTSDNEFAESVFNKLTSTDTLVQIRDYVIQNECSFGSDYLVLMKGIFEVCYAKSLEEVKKQKALLLLANICIGTRQ